MPQSNAERARKILSNPSFRELASARAKLRWSLSMVTLVMFALVTVPVPPATTHTVVV